MKRSPLVFRAATACLALWLASSAASAGPSGSHPYFPDGGTLTWFTDLGEAQSAARASGKMVFVEYGRRACTNCRTLVSKYVPSPMLRDRLSDACVGLAADCDDPDPRIEAMFRAAMPDACSLPFVAFVLPDLGFITGWAGATTPADIAVHLTAAEKRRAEVAVARTSAARAAPAPTPTATTPACNAATAGASRPTTGRSTPAADVDRARSLLVRARTAAGAGHHGEVQRLDLEAGRLAVRVDPAEWTALLRRSNAWVEKCLDEAATAASARRCDEAARLIGDVRREMAGQAAETEAARGDRAVAALKRVDASPEAGKESARTAAAKEFRGSRWAALFGG